MHRRSGPRSGTVLELSGPARQPRAASATVTWRPPGPGLTGRAAAAASRPHQQARESPLRGRHGGLAGSADSDPDWQEIIIQVKAAPAAQPTLTPQGDSGRLPSPSLYVPNLNRAAALRGLTDQVVANRAIHELTKVLSLGAAIVVQRIHGCRRPEGPPEGLRTVPKGGGDFAEFLASAKASARHCTSRCMANIYLCQEAERPLTSVRALLGRLGMG